MRPQLIIGALLVAGTLTSPLSSANAVGTDCTQDIASGAVDLADPTAVWDVQDDGSIGDGLLLAGDRDDAYDDFTVFSIDDGTNGREAYTNPAGTCTYEAGGRQVAFPAQTTVGGLLLSRKVYVPASGPSFARFYNQVSNPTAAPVTITLYTSDGQEGDLGSDGGTVLADSSGGPAVAFAGGVLNTPVSWFTTWDGSTTGDPVLAHNVDAGFGKVVADRVDSIQQDGSADALTFAYDNVTVPAGGTLSYLSFEALRGSVAEAGDAARFVDANPSALFAGLSIPELASVRNWSAGDIDADGVGNASDNCLSVANPTQSDVDKDGFGDACDADADGDGLANDVETAVGSNPLSADTDADGVRDNADQCLKVAGSLANGCPPSARRASTTSLKVKGTKTGPVVLKAKGTVRSKVTSLPDDCTHGSAAVIVKVGTEVVATKIVTLRAATCRFKAKIAIDMPRRKIGKAKVTGWFLGSDGLLPSRDKLKFKVKTA